MKILSMTAVFGGLNGATLRLEPGMNVISAPNEWGKSTWCAFLAAMLYGVDTTQRSTRGSLADKEKFAPWSGQSMEGTLRVEHRGRDITIQRRTRGRVPLGDFQAYETRTGVAVPELTAENCGQELLGVEKSVFLRTGFIRFSDLAVVPDGALWQRLQALVTTGDESGSGALLQSKLRTLKNKCRSPRGGQIPETEQKIRELEGTLSDRQMLEKRELQLKGQLESAGQEQEALQRHRAVCDYRDAQNLHQQTLDAMEAAEQARNAMEEMELRCRDVPEREKLEQDLSESRELIDRLRVVAEEEPPSAMGAVILCLLGLAAMVGGVLAVLAEKYLWAGGLAGAGILLLILAGVGNDRRRKKLLQQRLDQTKREKLVRELMEATVRLQKQLRLREELEEACRTADQARIRLKSLAAAGRQILNPGLEDELDLTLEETEARIAQVTERLRLTQLRLGQTQGRMDSLPDSESLLRELEGWKNRLAELLKMERALELALNALEEAARELQRRFAPRITAKAQEYLSRLTGGRYSQVLIGEDLSIQAASQAEATLRGSQWRSDGTADLMYLSLRLAVWVTLNPEGPLVLDDALIRLDDERLGQVLSLLKELSETRQVILFSCQQREKQRMEAL